AFLAEVGGKSDRAALGYRRVHELTYRREDGDDRLVMSDELLFETRFKLIEAAGELLARGPELPLHEPAHPIDAHLDGSGAVEDSGGHDGAVLGEGVRQVFAMLSPAGF